ncbi:MAG TPA: enoyl-CoA hydratase/isomerase family protein [Kofleriaceae bacterium]|nr:enoyl-CoA hydratase/isomerase family protein [Kofleriaceae bacterium]
MALAAEAAELAVLCQGCDAAVASLPPKPQRTAAEAATAEAAKRDARAARARFLRRRADEVYSILTENRTRPLRADELVWAAADRFPGLVPSREAVEQERAHPQRDKEGIEIDQGIFFCHILSSRTAGLHLVHTMLRPTPAAEQLLERFRADGAVDLGPVRVERIGTAGHVTLTNPSFLNAEDDSTVAPLETAVDLVLLDPAIEIGVLRGGVVTHKKYAGRRVFNAGINLTHLYHGKISFVGFFLVRDLGFVHKLYRGHTDELFVPDEPEQTVEKPWIAAVEAFAIGGGCQILLTMDHVLAEEDSYFNLPARKEGIIPGAANLRLPRAVGDRMARQAILYERSFPAASPEGALLCDEVVPRGGMDAAIERVVSRLTSAGIVSAAANRKALRVAEEPLDVFRRYMALYAREQAECHYSPALIRNLEQNWDAKRRVP